MAMEIVDSHTHWGPSVSMGTEVTIEELLRQAAQSNVDRIEINRSPTFISNLGEYENDIQIFQ
jgi:hypothetical protein